MKYWLIIFLVLALFIQTNITQHVPQSADPVSYVIQARIFLEGNLHLDTPENRNFQRRAHVSDLGKYHSNYPPGWPVLLALGFLLHMPINIILGLGSIILLYFIVKEYYNEKLAKKTLILMCVSPIVLFHSATYFPHQSTMFFFLLFLFLYLRMLKEHSPVLAILSGLSFSAIFLIRPFDAFLVSVATVPFLIFYKTEWKRKIILSLYFCLGVSMLIWVFFVYFSIQNGSLSPMGMYGQDDIPSFESPVLDNMSTYFNWFLLWIPLGSVLFLVLAHKVKPQLLTYYFWLLFGLYFVGYSMYWATGISGLGPRYLYPICFVIILTIAHLRKYWYWGFFLLSCVALMYLSIDFYELGTMAHERYESSQEIEGIVMFKPRPYYPPFNYDYSVYQNESVRYYWDIKRNLETNENIYSWNCVRDKEKLWGLVNINEPNCTMVRYRPN